MPWFLYYAVFYRIITCIQVAWQVLFFSFCPYMINIFCTHYHQLSYAEVLYTVIHTTAELIKHVQWSLEWIIWAVGSNLWRFLDPAAVSLWTDGGGGVLMKWNGGALLVTLLAICELIYNEKNASKCVFLHDVRHVVHYVTGFLDLITRKVN